MLSTSTRLRVQQIIERIEKRQIVGITDRTYLRKIAPVSVIVKCWLKKPWERKLIALTMTNNKTLILARLFDLIYL